MSFRVLVVDDNEDHRFLTRRAVRSLAGEFDVSASAVDGGPAALALLHGPDAAGFDLVLLDLKMHGMDGLEVLRALRGDARTRDLRVVLFSSSEQRSDREAAQQAGADEYVTKPMSADSFHQCVRETVARWAAKQAP